MEYTVTIYSPIDQEEHVFTTKSPAGTATRLISSMEAEAWFKIERTS